jgi:hypothetical protein
MNGKRFDLIGAARERDSTGFRFVGREGSFDKAV